MVDIHYREMIGLGSYSIKEDKIYLNKRLLDDLKSRDIILAHELEHAKAKKNLLKQIWIDFKSIFDLKFQKAVTIHNTLKDNIMLMLPITKNKEVYEINLFQLIMWIFILILILGLLW